jgi:hypothetical protein
MREQVDYSEKEQLDPVKPIEGLYMYDWIFHYNPYTNNWSAIPRDLYVDYWTRSDFLDNYSDIHGRSILRARHLNVLIDLLHKAKGDVEIIHDITRASDLI